MNCRQKEHKSKYISFFLSLFWILDIIFVPSSLKYCHWYYFTIKRPVTERFHALYRRKSCAHVCTPSPWTPSQLVNCSVCYGTRKCPDTRALSFALCRAKSRLIHSGCKSWCKREKCRTIIIQFLKSHHAVLGENLDTCVHHLSVNTFAMNHWFNLLWYPKASRHLSAIILHRFFILRQSQ